MKPRTILLAVTAWVAVVGLGAGLTWLVIDSAGQRVLAESGVPQVAVQASPLSSDRGGASPGDESGTQPAPSPAPRPTSSPATQQRSWRGAPGSVLVRCAGGAATLQSTTPNDGYRVEVGSRGPQEVEVIFRGNGPEVKVRGECARGVPVFSTETTVGSGGDD